MCIRDRFLIHGHSWPLAKTTISAGKAVIARKVGEIRLYLHACYYIITLHGTKVYQGTIHNCTKRVRRAFSPFRPPMEVTLSITPNPFRYLLGHMPPCLLYTSSSMTIFLFTFGLNLLKYALWLNCEAASDYDFDCSYTFSRNNIPNNIWFT